MINRAAFFTAIRGLLGPLKQLQVDGFNTILDEWESLPRGDKPDEKLAYILATVWHETANRMQPIKELGGEAYLKKKKYYPYYGRDLVQTTWKANYEKVAAFSGIDVVNNPDLIGQMPLAAKVAIKFMEKGWYTGKKLSDYINNSKVDFRNARRIINGMDKAEKIAADASLFLKAIGGRGWM